MATTSSIPKPPTTPSAALAWLRENVAKVRALPGRITRLQHLAAQSGDAKTVASLGAVQRAYRIVEEELDGLVALAQRFKMDTTGLGDPITATTAAGVAVAAVGIAGACYGLLLTVESYERAAQVKAEAAITQAVADGKITPAQADSARAALDATLQRQSDDKAKGNGYAGMLMPFAIGAAALVFLPRILDGIARHGHGGLHSWE